MIGQPFKVETSYYDIPGVDRFNTGTYTSNGERFDANDSARVASADLPDGTELLLRNPINGRVSHVLVNDFGPFRGNRRLDVTRRVAEDLDFKHKGVVQLDVIVIAAPADDDLTYRRNRERRATRGHLGVVFEPEMPALVSGLVAERNLAPQPGNAIAAREQSPPETAVTGPRREADVVAFADTVPSDNAEYERLANASSIEQQPPSHLPGLSVIVFGRDVEAHATSQTSTELLPATSEPRPASPALVTALNAPAAEGNHDTSDHTTAEFTPSASVASTLEFGSLATAAVATSDFAAAISGSPPNRNLLFALLAGLLSVTLAASLSAGHRKSKRTAPTRQLPVAGKSRLARTRSTELAPVASASAPAVSSAAQDKAEVSVRLTQPAITGPDRTGTLIAADITIEGQLRTTGRVEIAGRIKGRIEADELIVLEGGVVEGDVICRALEIAGTLTGEI